MNVSIEILEFPLCVKNKILKIKDITKLNIEYIAGKNIVFNNSNLGLKEDIDSYIKFLSEFYKINKSNINIKSFSLEELNKDNNLSQIIPNKKDNRFDKENLTLLSINT